MGMTLLCERVGRREWEWAASRPMAAAVNALLLARTHPDPDSTVESKRERGTGKWHRCCGGRRELPALRLTGQSNMSVIMCQQRKRPDDALGK